MFQTHSRMMQTLLCCCGYVNEENDDIEYITNSFSGTLHEYTHTVLKTTNFHTIKNTEWNSKPILFYPTHQDIVDRYSVNSLIDD